MASERYTAGEVIEKIREAQGLLSVAARLLGCSRQTVENYAKRHPTVARAIKEERSKVVDTAEGKLFEKLQFGEAWAIQFVLKTLGKDRGYTERREVTGAEGGPISIEPTIDRLAKQLQGLTDAELTRFIRTVSNSGEGGTTQDSAAHQGPTL